MKVDLKISDERRKKIAHMLEHLLADTYALYLQTQNAHWNVKGANFFSLHLLYEKQYTEMAEAIDEIAERIQTLGFYVHGTFAALKKNCCVKEVEKPLNSGHMLKLLIQNHQALIACAREIEKVAQDHDGATVDLMARRLGAHEKFLWMLSSHL